MASVLEYCTAEILELAGEVASANKRARITPRHLLLAVENDEEISVLFKKSGVVIAGAGVVPCIHKELLKMKSASKKKKSVVEAAAKVE